MIFERIVKILPPPLEKLCRAHEDKLSYVFFGGLTTIVSIASQFAAYRLGAGTAAATTISWVCAVTFAFFTNKIFVFKSKSHGQADWFEQAEKFFGARLTTYFLEIGFMMLTVEVFGFNEHIMKLIAQVFILIGNYFLSKFVIFKKKN
ncbi:MAG: GtrA family protein [Oscillospiraceae bacterium]|nr:GtrA family protein [Oscillospiraceae bacterium]